MGGRHRQGQHESYTASSTTIFLMASLVLQAITALGQAVATPVAYPMVVGLVPASHKARAVAVLESCFGVGLMVGPPLGGALYTLGGFYLPFWFCGVSRILVDKTLFSRCFYW